WSRRPPRRGRSLMKVTDVRTPWSRRTTAGPSSASTPAATTGRLRRESPPSKS
ncbi:MAG: hypothetical protein AVDCRST_MAG78-1508, partial [uncultured Rubrobacteraceae bacterium]